MNDANLLLSILAFKALCDQIEIDRLRSDIESYPEITDVVVEIFKTTKDYKGKYIKEAHVINSSLDRFEALFPGLTLTLSEKEHDNGN